MSSSSKSKLSVRRSTLNGKPKRKRRKVERENNRTGKDSSNGKIAESDKSKQPVPREFIDWLEGQWMILGIEDSQYLIQEYQIFLPTL